MLTKESINLRKYIYPKVDVQKSNELHKLYIFLKSIKRIPLKINYYHQIDQKTITIKKGKFIFENDGINVHTSKCEKRNK